MSEAELIEWLKENLSLKAVEVPQRYDMPGYIKLSLTVKAAEDYYGQPDVISEIYIDLARKD